MKLTTIISTAIAAVGLAACGSTAVAPTARPTLAPTVAATVAPTVAPTTAPTAIPTVAPTPKPKPKPGITVTVTCGNVIFTGVRVGDWLGLTSMDGPAWKFSSNPYTLSTQGWEAGRYSYYIWNDATSSYVWRGTFTIREC